MDHPFLGSRIGRIVFTAWWLAFSGIQFGVLHYLYDLQIVIALTDSLLSSILFSSLSLGLWYWVRYSDIETAKPLSLAINHLGASTISIALVVSIIYYILPSLFSSEALYIDFFNSSIPARVTTGLFLYILVTLIYYLIIYITSYREKLAREAELKALFKEAELNWLKLQVNPHFLFNSLNSVSSLTMTQPDKAQEMIIRLSELLRYSLSQQPESMVTLEMEINNCNKYLEIEKVRFGKRLVYYIDIAPNCLSFKIPGMILQPLFENAIKHSVALTPDESVINTLVSRVDDGIIIEISNTIPLTNTTSKGTGVGLENIRRRLKLMYGTSSLLSARKDETTFTVTLNIPNEK